MAEVSDIQGFGAEPVPPRDTAGLIRPRLINRLADPSGYLVGRVVAPAGSGKSRLLAHAAVAYQGPVAWCGSPDPIPRTEEALVEWLWVGLAPLLGTLGPAPADVDSLMGMIDPNGPPILMFIDDVHLLEGSDAETALGEFVRRLPDRLAGGLRLVIGSRVNLGFDLSRLRVSGQLVEFGPDDLRFRAWEVEELFRDIYRNPLIPEDVATLARRTSGWAAYLQLFHLATSRKSQAERRRLLASMASRSRLVQEYLASHVLAGLSSELQDFLIRTSVLRRPTGSLCDELLGWSGGSRELLAELERRHLFTERLDEDAYRYHAVLLSHLDARLVERLGVAAARTEHRRAAGLLEREGCHEDAAAAFARAEDWEGVARNVGQPGSTAAGLGGAWLEALPPAVVESDALLLMARAKRAAASGAWAEAIHTLRSAEEVAASALVAERCRHERDQIAAWLTPDRCGGTDWLGLLRSATQRQPLEIQAAAATIPGAQGRLTEGAAAYLAGDMLSASRILRGVASNPDASPVTAAAARLMASVASTMCGRTPEPDEIDGVRDEIDAADTPWLDRLAQAALVASSDDSEETLADLSEACRREGDRWGEALIALLSGAGSLWRGAAGTAQFERAARTFSELGAGVLETMAHAYLALSAEVAGERDVAVRHAQQARTLASLLDVPGSAAVAALAFGRIHGDEREMSRARDILVPFGTWDWHQQAGRTPTPSAVERHPAAPTQGQVDGSLPVRPPARLQCLGGFSLELDGRLVDEAAAKPMERTLLHLLCMRAGERVHREELIETLWPEADPDAGRHRLQVAVSALRRLLSPDPEDQSPVLAREGDSYRLALPEGADVDIWREDSALQRASVARGRNDDGVEAEALADALAIYRGPLLPSDGPAEWVIARRDALQTRIADAAARLAALRLQSGDATAATEAARAGLGVDRYRDDLWKVLIEAAERAGHHAEAGQARRAYAAVLEELGV